MTDEVSRHGSGDWALGRLLQNRRFDEAMVAFLECLRQLIECMEDRANDRGGELRGLHLYVMRSQCGARTDSVAQCRGRQDWQRQYQTR